MLLYRSICSDNGICLYNWYNMDYMILQFIVVGVYKLQDVAPTDFIQGWWVESNENSDFEIVVMTFSWVWFLVLL